MTPLTYHATGRELFADRPVWAEAVIVAELHVDVSDSQTDYFNHRTARAAVLAWSRHHRDLFPEMRKAAARFAPTAHLGPGKGDFRVYVVLTNDYITDARAYSKDEQSPWHREELDGDNTKAFDTRAAADAWIAQAPVLHDLHGTRAGHPAAAHFAYAITEERIEHREKWSMGHGYYLKCGDTHTSGWSVCKHSLSWLETRTHLVEDITSGARPVTPTSQVQSRPRDPRVSRGAHAARLDQDDPNTDDADPDANLTEQERIITALAATVGPVRDANVRLRDLRRALTESLIAGRAEPNWTRAPNAARFYIHNGRRRDFTYRKAAPLTADITRTFNA